MPILAKDEDKQRAIREKSTQDAASAQARTIGATSPANAARGTQVAAAKISAEPRRPVLTPAAKTTTNSVAPSQAAAVPKLAATTTKPTSASDVSFKKPVMFIQPIPPFKGKTSRPAGVPATQVNGMSTSSNGAASGSASNQAANKAAAAAAAAAQAASHNRLNVNASSFKPNARASAFTPVCPIFGSGPLQSFMLFLGVVRFI